MLDLAIILAFIAYAIGSGFWNRKKASKGLGEYFLAGKTISGWRAGFSMAATQFAADTPLLVVGLIATGGIFLIWRLWIYGLAFLLMAFVFAVLWRRAGVLTDAELTEIRYSGRGVLELRVLKAIYYGTIINCVVMAMVLVAAVRIAEVFLLWHVWLPPGLFDPVVALVSATGLSFGDPITDIPHDVATATNLISILLILVFTALYSTTGGLRSVISTDVAQFALAMIGTFAYGWIIVREAGGLGGITDRVVELYGAELATELLSFSPPDSAPEVLLPFLTIIGLQWFFQMNSDGTGYLAQRSMACRTDRDARIAGVVFAWAQILFRSLIWLVIGVGLLIIYPFEAAEMGTAGFEAGREVLFVQGVNDLLPTGILGMMLVGLLAALASTLDTHLNWGASYWSNDVYSRLVCQEWQGREAGSRELVVVARLSNILILVIALVIMANLGSIQAAWQISLLFGAGMGSVLVLRWLWERINLYSELAAIVVSIIVAPILLYSTDAEWIRLSVMSAASTAAAVGVTFITPKTDQSVLVSFYERVKPLGAWGTTARAAGHKAGAPARALWIRLRAAGLTGLSLFLLLVGIGRWMIPAPGISGFWTFVMIAAGLALIPLWWREAFVVEDLGVERAAEKPAPEREEV